VGFSGKILTDLITGGELVLDLGSTLSELPQEKMPRRRNSIRRAKIIFIGVCFLLSIFILLNGLKVKIKGKGKGNKARII
jgi:hypothetical protein